MTRFLVAVVCFLAACDSDDLGSVSQALLAPLPRFVATGFELPRGTTSDPFDLTHVEDGVAQRLREELIGPGCIGNCFQLRATWQVTGLPAAAGSYTLEIVARIDPSPSPADDVMELALRVGTAPPLATTCTIRDRNAFERCRLYFGKPAGVTSVEVSARDLFVAGPFPMNDPFRTTLHVDHLAVLPGRLGVPIDAPVSVAPGSTGNVASVADDPFVTGYEWTLAGGPPPVNPTLRQIQFGAGPAGTTMTLGVTRHYPLGDDAATRRVQVDFLDVPVDYPVHDDVVVLAGNGVTTGCGGGNYCPTATMLRNQVAVFLLLGKEGPGYRPPAPTGTMFGDVRITTPFAAWIEELGRRGVTAGCGGGNYCPNDGLTRAAAAVFVLRTAGGTGYVPPQPVGLFEDVPVTDPAAGYIEEAFRRDLFLACSDPPHLQFCPTVTITRARMATAIVRGFGLRFP